MSGNGPTSSRMITLELRSCVAAATISRRVPSGIFRRPIETTNTARFGLWLHPTIALEASVFDASATRNEASNNLHAISHNTESGPMSETVRLKSADGHELDAYVARPAGEPIAGLVVIQEIFGVNKHIRSIADGYARDGFLAIAPALFDRVERGVDLAYDGPDAQKGSALLQKLDNTKALEDVA